MGKIELHNNREYSRNYKGSFSNRLRRQNSAFESITANSKARERISPEYSMTNLHGVSEQSPSSSETSLPSLNADRTTTANKSNNKVPFSPLGSSYLLSTINEAYARLLARQMHLGTMIPPKRSPQSISKKDEPRNLILDYLNCMERRVHMKEEPRDSTSHEAFAKMPIQSTLFPQTRTLHNSEDHTFPFYGSTLKDHLKPFHLTDSIPTQSLPWRPTGPPFLLCPHDPCTNKVSNSASLMASSITLTAASARTRCQQPQVSPNRVSVDKFQDHLKASSSTLNESLFYSALGNIFAHLMQQANQPIDATQITGAKSSIGRIDERENPDMLSVEALNLTRYKDSTERSPHWSTTVPQTSSNGNSRDGGVLTVERLLDTMPMSHANPIPFGPNSTCYSSISRLYDHGRNSLGHGFEHFSSTSISPGAQ